MRLLAPTTHPLAWPKADVSHADQQALYHCPNPDCGIDFKSLAGMINHLESETCGWMRFSNVQKMVRGGRLIGY